MTPSQPDFEVPPDSSDGPVSAPSLDRALELVRFLRANCDWDAAQTPHSLLPYLLEEAHETADAVAAGDEAALTSELGDLLLNVAFQIVLAEEREAFSADDVVVTLESKMRRRHPHIYGDGPRVDWETLKAEERGQLAGEESLLHGIAGGMEPLSRAQRIQERVATVGFDWPDAGGALAKVHEEVEEVSALLDRPGSDEVEEEIGDLLFAVVNLARLSGVHSMRALVRANAKFSARFAALEELARVRGVQLGVATLEELDVLWDEVKLEGNRERERDR
ncbi:MAG TPA: nucleoside triphosphate pyrophosphohydrolase [Longimicrobiales bacterium]|nr:nucleoside triphosphate pyrophosphohydrolase [Longimicrobiales bacterium]